MSNESPGEANNSMEFLNKKKKSSNIYRTELKYVFILL